MKLNTFFPFRFLSIMCCFALLFSCKKDNPIGSNNNTTATLTVTLSKYIIDLNTVSIDSTVITVKDQNNVDVTSSCQLQVNGSNISSSTFVAQVAGTYVISATKAGYTSGSATLTVLPKSISGNDTLIVSLSRDTIENNGFDFVNVVVTNRSGTDITTTSQLSIVSAFGTTAISSKYSPTTTGTFNIVAKRSGLTSAAKVLTVLNPSPSPFSKKILVEDCTGAWCGYCPRVANALENYKAAKPNCIVVGVHGGGGTDPFKFQYYTNFNSTYNVSGYPTAILNRASNWSERTADLDAALTKYAPLGLAIESSTTGSSITGKVKVKFNVTTDSKMKIVIALVENGLLADQTNYYSAAYGNTPYLYGGVSPIKNFVHNGVLRRTATDLFGDAIPTTSQVKGTEYELPFSIPVSGQTATGNYTAVPANCGIVAFVIDGTTAKKGAYNVQYAAVGTVKNYD